MDGEQTVITVDIYGIPYKIKGHSNIEYMKRVASSIDESMKKLAKTNPRLDMQKLAVLCAMQTTEDVFRLRRDNARLQEDEARSIEIKRLLELEQQRNEELSTSLEQTKAAAEARLLAAQEVSDKQLKKLLALAEEQKKAEQAASAETIKAGEERLFRLKRDHEAEVKRLREELTLEKKTELVQLKGRLETELAKLGQEKDKAIAELVAERDGLIAVNVIEQEKLVAVHLKQLEEAIASVSSKKDDERKHLNEQWQSKWNNREREWTAAHAAERAELDQQAQEREKQWKQELAKLEQTSRSELERRRNGWLEERSKLMEQIAELQKTVESELQIKLEESRAAKLEFEEQLKKQQLKEQALIEQLEWTSARERIASGQLEEAIGKTEDLNRRLEEQQLLLAQLEEETARIRRIKDELEINEEGLRERIEIAMREASATSDIREQWEERTTALRQERDAAANRAARVAEEHEALLEQHNKLKLEYSKLQTEYNEWIELIEQS